MGTTSSASKSKTSVKNRRENVNKLAAQQVSKIEEKERELEMRKDTLPVAVMSDIHVAAQIGKAQLNRGGAPFTRADYVAILIRLNNEELAISKYEKFTVDELRAVIRAHIYDVDSLQGERRITGSAKSAQQPTLRAPQIRSSHSSS